MLSMYYSSKNMPELALEQAVIPLAKPLIKCRINQSEQRSLQNWLRFCRCYINSYRNKIQWLPPLLKIPPSLFRISPFCLFLFLPNVSFICNNSIRNMLLLCLLPQVSMSLILLSFKKELYPLLQIATRISDFPVFQVN